MHAHASLEFKITDFSLLCDPWLIGSAFLGGWRHYPKPLIHPKQLSPNAILITHEHSDHFHENTLKFFSKDTPIYFPNFTNKRIQKRLKDMGFTNIFALDFGQRIQVHRDFFITLYEPTSLWNDCIVLFEIGDFRLLNINDAGINHRIAKQIDKVHCVASSFSPGASGYPINWTNYTEEQKSQIYENTRIRNLEMLHTATQLYGAQFMLPFASHIIPNHPKNAHYIEIMHKNTINDVIKAFENSPVRVIDLLAGDSFELQNFHFNKIPRDLENLYSPSVIKKYIQDEFDEHDFALAHPDSEKYKFDREKAIKYFENLNNIPQIIFCEDLVMSVYPDSDENLAFSFEIKNGHLTILESLRKDCCVSMKIPSSILAYIYENNESWDEATIGYWCEFWRSDDVYHAEFWRLLQTPYYVNSPSLRNISESENAQKFDENTQILKIIECLGENAQSILCRYGLYCTSCSNIISEKINTACANHGINKDMQNRLISELNRHIN